jgi:predicted cupin superfamily sugar epimerase
MEIENSQYWINHLKLLPHPEGGYYKETFRSTLRVSRELSTGLKQACTSIYYLLEGTDYSGFHRLKSDEIWYFHKGAPLLVYILNHDGELNDLELSDNSSGNLSVVIPAGLWFAAEVANQAGFTLASCAVAPGFDFAEFEMAKKDDLIKLHPQHLTILSRLCR